MFTENWQWGQQLQQIKAWYKKWNRSWKILERLTLWRRGNVALQDMFIMPKNIFHYRKWGHIVRHLERRSAGDAVKQESHPSSPSKKLFTPKCQQKLRNPKLGHERPSMSCLHDLPCRPGYHNLWSVREISIFLPTFTCESPQEGTKPYFMAKTLSTLLALRY